MPRITEGLHNALVEISINGTGNISETIISKLELMGLIIYDFGGRWKLTEEGRQYFAENHQAESISSRQMERKRLVILPKFFR